MFCRFRSFRRRMAIVENAEERLFAASGHTSISLLPTQDVNVLALTGYMVDVIDKAGAVWHEREEYPKWHDFSECVVDYWYCAKSTAQNEPRYATAERQAEAAWRVPVGDLGTIEGGYAVY